MSPTPRRTLLLAIGASALASSAAAWLGLGPGPARAENAADDTFEFTRTEEEWRKLLSPEQHAVLRREGTERPHSSPLNAEHREGRFSCAGCALALFSSKAKFDSGTGWPSFWKPLDRAVVERQDRTLGIVRTEVRCRRCGGHLGHVFDDGPRPTGLRYCMNGVAMTFAPGPA